MPKLKRILIVADSKDYTDKLLLTDVRKRVKGFLRVGCDVQVFSPNLAMRLAGNGLWMRKVYKPRVDELLARQIKNYEPHIVYIGFSKFIDYRSLQAMRQAAPNAVLAGYDVDIYPELQKGRVETAVGLDCLFATYAGAALAPYERKGIRCVFMPNICDPDIEHRYAVPDSYKSDIVFTGKVAHGKYPTDAIRSTLLNRLSKTANFRCYGSFGRDFIGGLDYYYAIGGAKIGLSINADNSIPLYHSDRLTQYLACGTCVLAKKVPDSEKLFRDAEHLRYFESADEFFDLAQWYLVHEQDRLALADRGMEFVHREYSCEKIARYTLDVIEKGSYQAPWN